MYTFAERDIFEIAKQRSEERALMTSAEWNFVADIGASCFLERPDRAAWLWADDGNVYLDDKMSPEPGPYDSAKTPWAREWQELPLRYDVREAYCMKSSRVGWTEAMFNIVRWMPRFWPGNCGIVYPDDKLGRDVMKRRVTDSVSAIAVNQMTDDPNDKTLSQITLKNMVIKCGPSGAARMFVEWWVRFFVLDEIEEHDQSDTTTTVDRALSRQSDVSDALLFGGSKPKKAGGPIDKNYIRGTQKKYELPCPRCERRIELLRSHFSYDECRHTNGTWDLDLVEKETRYRCQHCQEIIEEKEKFSMNQEGIWIPTPLASRRTGTDGKYVPPEPHVESYQISDYYSHHQELTWGKLMRRYLMAFEVSPDENKKTHFINNHEGMPDEPKLIQIDVASIRALVAGIVEEREIKASDGTSIKVNLTVGMPGGFKLAYRQGQIQSALPFRPVLLLIFIDKQNTFLKYTVFGVVENGEAMLIDLGQVDDEDALYYIMLTRPYFSEGHTDPMYITAGFFDARYRPHDVYKFCLKAYFQKGVNIWPVRGEGMRQDENNSKTEAQYRGKTFRLMEDQCELGKLFVRYFKDAALKAELYLNLIQKRAGPRVWLPNDYPETLASELTAERWDEEKQIFIHDKVKHGPNDFGDCFKYLTLWRMENLVEFLANHMPPPELPEPPAVREYILHPREGPPAD